MKTFITFAFYMMAILPIFWELWVVSNTESAWKFKQSFRNKDKTLSGSHWVVGTFHLLYFIWNIIGLFTFQWPMFLLLFLLGLIPKRSETYMIFDAVFTVALLLFIIINKSSLHIHLIN